MADEYIKTLRVEIARRRELVDEMVCILRDKQKDTVKTYEQLYDEFEAQPDLPHVNLIKSALGIAMTLVQISRHEKVLYDLGERVDND